jgi:hypothetical protein
MTIGGDNVKSLAIVHAAIAIAIAIASAERGGIRASIDSI